MIILFVLILVKFNIFTEKLFMQSNKKFFAAGTLSYLLWGFLPVMFKLLSNFKSTDIIFYRICLSAIFIGIFFLFTKFKIYTVLSNLYQKSRSKFLNAILLNFIGSLCLVSNWLIYAYVVQHINVHTAAIGYLILPIITAFLALIILKESLSSLQWIAIGLSSISCYLISHIAIQEVLYILTIALSYSFYLITQRRNIYTTRLVNLGLQTLIGSLLMFFFVPNITPVQNLTISFWIYLPLIAIFFTVTPLLLNMYALHGINTASLSFIGYINPIMGFLLGIFIYNEKIGTTEAIAYIILALSLLIFNWTSIRQFFFLKQEY